MKIQFIVQRGLLSLVMLMCSACASLAVKVEVLDPAIVEKFETEDSVRKFLNAALSRTTRTAEEFFIGEWPTTNTLRSIASAEVDKAQVEDKSKTAQLQTSRAQVEAQTCSANEKSARLAAIRLESLHAQIAAHTRVLDSEKVARFMSADEIIAANKAAMISNLLDRQYRTWKEIDVAASQCASALKKIKGLPPESEASRLRTSNTNEIQKQTQDELYNVAESLRSSKNAFVVSKAADKFWTEGYNYAKGDGLFGGSDIAIKLNKNGSFSVKGLTFDPSDSIRLMQKVAMTGLSAMAMHAGMPGRLVGTKAPETANGAGTDKTGQAISAVSEILSTRKTEQQQWITNSKEASSALLRIANMFLSVCSSAVNDDCKAARAKEDIEIRFQNAYDAHKGRLSVK